MRTRLEYDLAQFPGYLSLFYFGYVDNNRYMIAGSPPVLIPAYCDVF